MKKNILILLLLCNSVCIVSQAICETAKEGFNDLNTITKCSIVKSKKSTSRFLKRRKSQVSGLGVIHASGVESTKTGDVVSKGIDIPQKSNFQKLKENLSKEQLKNSFKFDEVDIIPLFKKCKFAKKSKAIGCFNTQMIEHIQEHFSYPHEAAINKIEGDVWIRFVIDDQGNVTNLKTLAPKNGGLLKKEAERVISKLPIFKPAMKNGNNVLVKYGFPINFSLEE